SMSFTFSDCSSLTSLNVSGWNTKKARVYYTFSRCPNLTILDLSGWSLDGTDVWDRQRGLFETSGATPLLVKTTDTKLKNYNYVSDNRTKLGTVKIAAENGKFEGNKQELTLFDAYTTDQEFNEELINSQLDTRKDQLVLADWVKFKEWTSEATYTTFTEKAGGIYNASVIREDWEWTYSSTNNVVTLTKYIGESKDVVIPTAKDCGHEGATAKISKEVLQQAVNAVSATSLTTSDNGDKIVVSSTDLSHCFASKRSLTTMDLSNLDVSNVTKMSGMFYNCSGLTSLDVSNWDTSKVTNMAYMFSGCSGLTSLDVSHFDTSNVTDISAMFNNCSGLTSLDVSHFDTSNVTKMYSMFSGCSGLTSLDVSHFDTSNVTDMSYMFSRCSGLTSLDVSHFDTSKVTTMADMFNNCSGLTSLDVSHFDTSNVTKMFDMFSGCSGLTSLDVSHFDTSKVTTMAGMFNNCPKLTSLDVSHFDTSNVTNMSYMFRYCSGLTTLDLSSWNCDKVAQWGRDNMFKTDASTPLLVKTTDTMLKNYNYASDNRTKFGTVKIAAENGKFEGDVQELSLFDYTTDKDLTEAGVTSQLETMK
ncbi:BspA family leucine-rich repeat surface protein, partial [Enterococcus faecium]|nr:BspA family leucine-rich repeat surface protein [Enterococcus faecium]